MESEQKHHSPSADDVVVKAVAASRAKSLAKTPARQTKPVFQFSLGGMSCYCMQSVKAESGTEFLEAGRNGKGGTYAAARSSSPQGDGFGSRSEIIATTAGTTTGSLRQPASMQAESAGALFLHALGDKMHSIGEKVESILHVDLGMHPASEAGHAATSMGARETMVQFDPFVEAVLAGRLIEAYRTMCSMQPKDVQKLMDHKALERLKRLGCDFDESLKELQLPSEAGGAWIVERSPSVSFAVQQDISKLRVISVTKHTGDPLLAFAALCEVDIAECNLEQVKALSERCDESLWLLLRGQEKQEELVEAHCANALSEEGRFLWVSRKTAVPARGETHHRGTPLPRVTPGYSRLTHGERTVFRIEPAESGFILTVSRTSQLSQGGQFFTRFKPTFWLRRQIRNETSAFCAHFNSLLQRAALAERLRSSGRAAFYEQIRRQLASKTQSFEKPNSSQIATAETQKLKTLA